MEAVYYAARANLRRVLGQHPTWTRKQYAQAVGMSKGWDMPTAWARSEEHTSELQSQSNLVCRLLLENKMQLDNQKEIAEMQNETQEEIAGIQSATSRQNTKDQVYAQNEMLAYQQKESTARVTTIMESTNLTKQQHVS